MRTLRPPLRSKPILWDFKNPQKQSPQIQISLQQSQKFQIYLLTNPQQLKKQFIHQVPYFWVNSKLSNDRQYQKYLNQLKDQLIIFHFPYVDNMLHQIEMFGGDFKIICEVKDLERIMEFHLVNKKLLAIYIFDQNLKKASGTGGRLLKNKKIEVQSDEFKMFKKIVFRKKYDKNTTQIFMNATKISNWDLAQVNKSRLVLKTLLVSKNDSKGKQDFVKLASLIQKDQNQVYEYQKNYKVNLSPEQVIKQYSKQSFLHRLVNNTLKAGKGNPLFLSYIRFPVKQLYKAINSRYKSQKLCQKFFQCYRGGMINENQLNYFIKNKKGFIEMQGFVSCSMSKTQVQQFIGNVVFKIKVNNLQRDPEWDHGFTLLDSKDLTHFIKQEQVLFNIFSVMQILSVQKQKFGRNQIDVITLQYGSLAAQLYKKKNGLQITSHQKRCISNYQALKPYYDSIRNQGDCFQFFNQYKLTQEYYLKVLSYYQKIQKNKILNDLQIIEILNSYLHLGSVSINLKQFQKAKNYYLKANQQIQKLRNIQNADSIKIAQIYNGLGLAYKNLNKISQSKKYYQKSIEILGNKKNGKTFMIAALNNLAGLYSQQCKDQQALKLYQRALDLVQTQNSQTTANIFYNIGIIYFQRQNFKLAIKNLQKTLQIYNQTFGTHLGTLNTYFKLGQVYLKTKSFYQSEKCFQSSLNIAKQLYGNHLDQKYINLKRQIQNLKFNEKRNNIQGIASKSLSTHKISDVFDYMNSKDQFNKLLNERQKTISMIEPSKYQSNNLSLFQTNNSSSFHQSNLSSFNNDKNDKNDRKQKNNQQKLRYFRGQSTLDNNTIKLVINKNQKEKEELIQSKLVMFDKEDFIKNLQAGKRKVIKLY